MCNDDDDDDMGKLYNYFEAISIQQLARLSNLAQQGLDMIR